MSLRAKRTMSRTASWALNSDTQRAASSFDEPPHRRRWRNASDRRRRENEPCARQPHRESARAGRTRHRVYGIELSKSVYAAVWGECYDSIEANRPSPRNRPDPIANGPDSSMGWPEGRRQVILTWQTGASRLLRGRR